jgi:hypothetical protein
LSVEGLVLEGPLPFGVEGAGSLTFVEHEHVLRVATLGAIVSIAPAEGVCVGVAMLDGELRSTLCAPGLSGSVRSGVLLRTANDTFVLLVQGVRLGDRTAAPDALDVAALFDRTTKLLRFRRSQG